MPTLHALLLIVSKLLMVLLGAVYFVYVVLFGIVLLAVSVALTPVKLYGRYRYDQKSSTSPVRRA